MTKLLGKNVVDIACGGVHNLCLTNENKGFDQKIYKCFKDNIFCDFEIICYVDSLKEVIRCHSLVLSANSSFFHNLIRENNQKYFEIKVSDFELLHNIITYIYTKNSDLFDKYRSSKHLVEILKITMQLNLLELFRNIENRLKLTFNKFIEALSSVKISDENKEDGFKGLFFLPSGNPIIILDDEIVSKITSKSLIINFDEKKVPAIKSKDHNKTPKYKHGHVRQSNGSNEKEKEEEEVMQPEELKVVEKLDTVVDEFIMKNNLFDLNNKSLEYASFINDKFTYDLKIKVAGETLLAHKVIVCSHSKFFQAKEEIGEEYDEVEITSMGYEDFLNVLLFMYNDEIKLTFERSLKFLEACDTLMIDSLKNKLETFICSVLEIESAAIIFKYASVYNCEKLKSICLSFIKENYTQVVETDEFGDLHRDLLLEIIRFCKP